MRYIFRNKLSLLVLMFAAAFILRLPYLNKPLMKDEGRLYKSIGLDAKALLTFIITKDAHPPFYYLLSKAWSALSDAVWWMRLLNVILGALTVVLLYNITLRLYDERVAILASYIACISPNLVYISQVLKAYSLGTFLISCAALFFITYWEKRNRLHLILYGICALISAYTYTGQYC